jgi:hypothetical protein
MIVMKQGIALMHLPPLAFAIMPGLPGAIDPLPLS